MIQAQGRFCKVKQAPAAGEAGKIKANAKVDSRREMTYIK